MIIDAHQHLWRLGENDCTWPTPELTAIYRNFELQDLQRAAAEVGVSGSILVQSQESDRDTDWLLELASHTSFVLAVVGWADLKAPGAPKRIGELTRHAKFRGLRPMLQSLPTDWLADDALAPAIEAMEAYGLAFDALVYARHLPALRELAQSNPDMRIVVDHGAKPPIASGEMALWCAEIDKLATLPNVWCKLSGLATEAGALPPAAIAPYVTHLARAFGAARLMWGSDWPVLLQATTYKAWFDTARAQLDLSDEEFAWVFGGAARAFYRV